MYAVVYCCLKWHQTAPGWSYRPRNAGVGSSTLLVPRPNILAEFAHDLDAAGVVVKLNLDPCLLVSMTY